MEEHTERTAVEQVADACARINQVGQAIGAAWTPALRQATVQTAAIVAPMAIALRQSPAWCAHVDQVRLDYYRHQVAAFKIRN